MLKINAFINGRFISTKNKIEILSPETSIPVSISSSLSSQQINQTFNYAKLAQKKWELLLPSKRITFILKFKKSLNNYKNDIVNAMLNEIAKPISDAKKEFDRTIDMIDQIIDEYKKVQKKEFNHLSLLKAKKEASIILKPLGIILAISPFNYPLNLAISKIVPSLIVGNSVVFKAATNGSGVGYYIAKAIDEAKLPNGVFNFVVGRGSEIGESLISPLINGITFTGSEGVGKGISEKSKMAIETYELGGNDAAIILKDANIDLAIKQIVSGALSYSGQRCTAIKRVLIQKSIKDKFIKKLLPEISKLSIGLAKDDSKITALIDKKASDKVEMLVKKSVKMGAKKLTPFSKFDNLIQPLVLDNVTSKMPIFKEEQFGPIIPITIFETESEAIELNNNTNYGLQASIFTKNINKAKKIALELEVGSVNINGSSQRGPDILPFGGVKNSGLNTQGIKNSLLTVSRPFNIINNY